jgi:DNA polymerase elongation subunit (family B)
MILQPLTWKEHDSPKYVVDVYGRTHEGDITRVRLVGFKPYFYIRELRDFTKIKNKFGQTPKYTVEEVLKSDVIQGFNSLKKERFYKLSFEKLWDFKLFVSELKKLKIVAYESNFPPYLKLIHERNISPASPFEFSFKEHEKKSGTYEFYDIDYKLINPTESKIPLYIMSYDLEVYSETGFPQSDNPSSEIMQIGVSTRWTDNLLEPVERFVLVSGKAISTDPSLKYICCSGERDLLLKFQDLIKVEEPDIITGYNTFGFDDGYLYDRFQKYHLEIDMGREDTRIVSKTFELASGKYAVRYLEMNGRLSLDLLLYARREFNLDSYKLDNVAGVFLRDKVLEIIIISGAETRMFEIHTKSTRGLFAGNYVKFDIVTNTSNPYAEGKKFYVKEIFETKFIVELTDENYLNTFDDLSKEERKKLEWSFCKDDVSIKQIMDSHRGTTEQKSEIARYCIQDCDLVLTLLAKLDVLTNSRGMADVCRVPLEYIFANRGQGIRIYSAVLYEASKQEQIIQTQECAEGDISYEGAIVIEPKIGMYLDTPIAVLDYNSLYPSNMIAYNLSPDTLVYVNTYDEHGRKIEKDSWKAIGLEEIKKNFKLDEVSYDHHGGRQSCGYVQEHEGLLPRTLKLLLKKRKDTRKLMESEKDDSQKSVLNGLQLAYKTVANSIYGQTGSRTSPIRRVEVAACTTAIGRERLLFAKQIAEEQFGGQVIYGDTDSIFINFNKPLQETIDLAKIVGQKITSLCRSAHKIDYEKTFFPFLLFCRKRYAGLMYEDDITKCKRKFMGISLKRRDSAPIVKDIYGGALDILLEHRSLKNAESFVKESLVKVLKNEIPLEKFIITKQLRDDYKNPEQIAHRVLADRMTLRDPGNIPQVGERLAFIYVSGRSGKQGDRIENLDYVRQKGLKPDSEFYITNQIQNPVAQLFALGIEQLTGYVKKSYPEFPDMDEEERTLKILSLKEKELDSILFTGAQYLRKEKRGPLDSFFTRK